MEDRRARTEEDLVERLLVEAKTEAWATATAEELEDRLWYAPLRHHAGVLDRLDLFCPVRHGVLLRVAGALPQACGQSAEPSARAGGDECDGEDQHHPVDELRNPRR